MKLFLLIAFGVCLEGWNCTKDNSSKLSSEATVEADFTPLDGSVKVETYSVVCATGAVNSAPLACSFVPVDIHVKDVTVEYTEVKTKTRIERKVEATPK